MREESKQQPLTPNNQSTCCRRPCTSQPETAHPAVTAVDKWMFETKEEVPTALQQQPNNTSSATSKQHHQLDPTTKYSTRIKMELKKSIKL